LIHVGERTSGFVRKAGTVILAVAILLWFMLHLPWGVEDQRDSLFGGASATIAPLFRPLGFGNWESAGSLMSGFIAKEIVVSTMSQIYLESAPAETEEQPSLGEDVLGIARGFGGAVLDAGKALLSMLPGIDLTDGETETEDTALSAALQTHFSLPAALAFVVFVLLYVPCAATLGAIRHEYGLRWAVFSTAYQLTLAWIVAFAVYQVGRLLGVG
jgi:ferrous iron transport protein B